jgi:hypothetical protein
MNPLSKGERLSETIVKPRSLGFPSLAKLVKKGEAGDEESFSLIAGSNHNAESASALKVILAGQEN